MKNPKNLEEAFQAVCDDMLAMFIKKHKDYGKGNILDTKELGIAFRISDKLNRLKHLCANNKNPQNETIEESWIDIAVYAVIGTMYRKKWFQKLDLKNK